MQTQQHATLPRSRLVHFDLLGESSSAYAWELRGGVACLIPQHDHNDMAAPIHAALLRQDGLVEFCADAALPPVVLSAFLMSLARMPAVQRLRLSGHLQAASVPALCYLMEHRGTLQSLECAYYNLPVALLEQVADVLSTADNDDNDSSSLTRVQILSTSVTSQEQLAALCQVVDKLPRVQELALEHAPKAIKENNNNNRSQQPDFILATCMLEHDFSGLRTLSLPYPLFAKHGEEWKQALTKRNRATLNSSLQRLVIRHTVSATGEENDVATPMDLFDSFRQCLPSASYLASVDFEDDEWQVEWILTKSGIRVCLVFCIVDDN